jgi:hypothetical protein
MSSMTAESLTRFGHPMYDGNDNADTHTDEAMGVAKSGEGLQVPPLLLARWPALERGVRTVPGYRYIRLCIR